LICGGPIILARCTPPPCTGCTCTSRYSAVSTSPLVCHSIAHDATDQSVPIQRMNLLYPPLSGVPQMVDTLASVWHCTYTTVFPADSCPPPLSHTPTQPHPRPPRIGAQNEWDPRGRDHCCRSPQGCRARICIKGRPAAPRTTAACACVLGGRGVGGGVGTCLLSQSVLQFVCPSICLSFRPSGPSVHMSVSQSIGPSICPSVCLSVRP
jgi:hypothetical protein